MSAEQTIAIPALRMPRKSQAQPGRMTLTPVITPAASSDASPVPPHPVAAGRLPRYTPYAHRIAALTCGVLALFSGTLALVVIAVTRY